MPFALLVGVSVDEAIDTTSSNGGSGDFASLFASPRTRLVARTEGFDRACYNGGLRGLGPLTFLLMTS